MHQARSSRPLVRIVEDALDGFAPNHDYPPTLNCFF